MILEDYIEILKKDGDEDLVIYQKDELNIDSEIKFFNLGDVQTNVVFENGIKYIYLIETFIAKEFLTDWLNSLKILPTDQELAQRLFDYARNDA